MTADHFAAAMTLSDASVEYVDASNVAETARRKRDEAVRRAHAQGMGIREIAREAGMDPTQVSRIVRR